MRPPVLLDFDGVDSSHGLWRHQLEQVNLWQGGGMARGRDAHQAHQQAVAALGRNLSRRARSRCELCEASGALAVVEVAGGPKEPEEDWAVMLCQACRDAVAGRSRRSDDENRFLEGAVWSEVVPAQVVAVRLARSLAERQVPWAVELIDGLYLDPAVEERL